MKRVLTVLILVTFGGTHLAAGETTVVPVDSLKTAFAKRIEIANYWHEKYPYVAWDKPSQMNQDQFVKTFGGVFEHSSWIAKRAFQSELSPAHDCAVGLHAALTRVFREASEKQRLRVLTAHPDLAGKLAAAKQLTKESTGEQKSAGLNQLTDHERAEFNKLNTAYVKKFSFPFIVAVKGLSKAQILAAFKTRLNNTRGQELTTAAKEVEKIALLRLKDLLP